MISISTQRAAEFVKGRLLGKNGIITYITTDSRTVRENCLFVAVKGERFDGHSFIEAAWEGGADCVISEKEFSVPDGKSLILVENTRTALLNLAEGYRSLFNIPVVAVTGSVGKTTTKDIIAGVLSQKYNVLKTSGNFNNDIGVPITLFSIEKGHEAAVVEMGMNHSGEIDVLAKAVRPDIGVITNIGVSHIENLGSREGIMKAKCEMFPYIKEGGFAVLNGDDDMLSKIEAGEYGLHGGTGIVWYGTDEKFDIWASDIEPMGIDGIKCRINTPRGDFEALISVPGVHMVYNAMAAAAVGIIENMDLESIKKGIESFIPTGMRMEKYILSDGSVLIDDSYNANPVSMKSAIDVLASCTGYKSAVLGDMFELGGYSDEMHKNVGLYAAAKGINEVIAIGENSLSIFNGAREAGMNNIKYYKTVADFLKSGYKPCGTVLIKASHSMRFSEIADYIKTF